MTQENIPHPTMKVSVLVAVYNAEQYLQECLDSLLRQSHDDIEILCVDDCSTDGSWQLLQSYTARDSRISAWKQPCNQGQAKARNLALSHATGDIIMFLDSDDWLSDNAIGKMVECLELNPKTDCVLFDVRYIYPDGRDEGYRTPPFNVMDGKTAFMKSLTWDIHGVYAARATLYRSHPYDDTCRHYSDDNTTRIHYYLSKEVRCCEGKYFYRQQDNSTSHTVNISQLDYLRANESMKRQLVALGCDNSIMVLYENQRWINLIGVNLFIEKHKRELDAKDVAMAREEIKRVWKGIEYKHLYARNKYKLGYFPFASCWSLFALEQKVFTLLRIFFNRDIK